MRQFSPMLRDVLLFAALCFGWVATTAAQATDVSFKPSGKWVVDFSETGCIASREYSVGSGNWAIGLEPVPATSKTSLLLLVPDGSPRFDDARISVGGAKISSTGMTLRGSDTRQRRLYASELQSDELERLQRAERLTISLEDRDFPFAVETLDDLMPVLERCVSQFFERWGFSQERQTKLATYPVPKKELLRYLTSYDYPSSALQRGAMGAVDILLMIGTDGRPTSCTVTQSSGHQDLDEASCEVFVQRARFDPARDKAGQPMEAPYTVQLRWQLG